MLDQKGSRKRQLDEGHCILNKLVDVCLLESPRNYLDGDLKMHDLVRDMALKVTEGKYIAICRNGSLKEIPDEERYWTKDLEKMSLMDNGICKIPDVMSPNCPKLSTLVLGGNRYLQVIPSSFFSQMYGLCTLDLCGNQIRKLPNSVSELTSLKALILSDCRKLESVPYIGKLTALRELDLSDTAIDEVPQGMEKLVSLRCLKMGGVNLKELPSGLLLKFPKLQHLCLPYQIQAPAEEIERLEWLEEFQGRVKDLCDFNRLYKCLQSTGSSGLSGVLVSNDLPKLTRAKEVLGEVIMHGSVLEKEEGKDAVMLAAQDIQHLTLAKCKGMSNCLLEYFARSNINPKPLVTLRIYSCGGIECILKREQFLKAKEESEYKSFQMLEDMVLYHLPDFVGAMMLQTPASPPPTQVVFSSLKRLSIVGCPKMSLGLPASELQSLELLRIERCKGIEEIIVVAAGEEGRGGEQGDEPARVFLPRLVFLQLVDLPGLKSICGATMVCDSIGRIYIFGCPSLKKLPLYFPAGSGDDKIIGQPCAYSTPPALQEIGTRREWWESLEWEHPSHKHLLQPFCRFD